VPYTIVQIKEPLGDYLLCKTCDNRFIYRNRSRHPYCMSCFRLLEFHPQTLYQYAPPQRNIKGNISNYYELHKIIPDKRCEFCGHLIPDCHRYKVRKYCSRTCNWKSFKQRKKFGITIDVLKESYRY